VPKRPEGKPEPVSEYRLAETQPLPDRDDIDVLQQEFPERRPVLPLHQRGKVRLFAGRAAGPSPFGHIQDS
jgi:hypothetical protein